MDFHQLSSCQSIHLLLTLPGLGPAAYWKLLHQAGSPHDIFNLPQPQLRQTLGPRLSEEVIQLTRQGQHSPHYQRMLQQSELLQQIGAEIISHDNPDYPPLLLEIDNPPPVLYLRGNRDCLNAPQMALVGSRSATRTGLNNANQFAAYLSKAGFVISSGLALGIDAAAHRGCIDSRGRTLAVMGTGIDWIYPRRHHQLAQEILASEGALVTEFAPGTVPQPGNFPRRNRLISGLSLGVLVVEAALKSGSLITARHALEQGREVFALPGSIHNPCSRGCHSLIREGATLVEKAEDIINQLQGWLLPHVCPQPSTNEYQLPPLNSSEEALLELIDYAPVSLELLIQTSPLSIADILANLSSLELKGLIEQQPQGYLRLGGNPVEDHRGLG